MKDIVNFYVFIVNEKPSYFIQFYPLKYDLMILSLISLINKTVFIISAVLLYSLFSCTQNKKDSCVRSVILLNDGWEFITDELSDKQDLWHDNKNIEIVSLPHTWNKKNLFDSTTYKRAKFQYNREVKIDYRLKNKKLFLHFDGINQIAEVFLNSKLIGRHKGGYTAFTVEITDYVTWEKGNKNILSVVVDNRFTKNIPPLSADFNFSGGIYRDVWLIATNSTHFSFAKYGSNAVFISTPEISAVNGVVKITGSIQNQSDIKKDITIVNTILDKNDEKISQFKSKLSINSRAESEFTSISNKIPKPALWSPDNPNLYYVNTELFENGVLIDRVTNPLGFRTFTFHPDKGLFLNGKQIKLMGSNRHQDYDDIGFALPDSLHIKDMRIAKEAGFNFIRLAHYPQSSVVLNKADELGLIVWEEIPIVNYVTTSQEFKENSELMLKEMIYQHFNHPSILIWGYMNEVFLHDADGERSTIMNFPEKYLNWTVAFAKSLDSLAHVLDPSRFTAITNHQNDLYNETDLNKIPDVVGYNLYQGWYFGKAESFGRYIDHEHSTFPDRRIVLSEYGAGSDIS